MSNFNDAFPLSLELTDNDTILQILWDDNYCSRHRLAVLRAACPCASCQGHHPSQSLNLQPEQFSEIKLIEVAPVGRYAYNLVFSDSHSTGIYTLEFLRKLENTA